MGLDHDVPGSVTTGFPRIPSRLGGPAGEGTVCDAAGASLLKKVEKAMRNINYPDLTPLFRPSSIAIIGASNDVKKVAGLPLKFALDHHFKGKLFPVNPKRETVQGIKAYPSVADIPEEVDAAVIVIPAAAVGEALRQCGEKGVKTAVIGVSGFAELNEEGWS